jgi:hypothetical protein
VFRRVPDVNSPQPDFPRAFMPHPKLCVPSIIFFIALARAPAEGQTISSPYSFVEHSKEWAISVGKSDLNPGQLGLGPRDATTASGHFGVAFGGAMSFDVDATMFLADRDVLDVSRPVDDRSIGRTKFNILLTDFKLRLNLTGQRTWRGFQPFVIFGGGLALAAYTDRTLELATDMSRDEWYEFGTKFTASFGGGLNYHVSDRTSLRLDGLMNLWKISTPLGWRTRANDPDGTNPEGEWVGIKSFKIGVAWRL